MAKVTTKMRIVSGSMGCFLNPPGDAEYKFEVRDGSRAIMSLRAALDCEWAPDSLKDEVRAVLAANIGEYTPEWEQQCYAYFKGCYSPDGVDRNVSNLVHAGPPEHHLAFLHIRQFFPEATPNLALIADPGKWGK